MTAVTTLRSTIATALTDTSLYSIFSFPPETPIANSVVVEPNDPYLVPSNNSNIGISPLARFRIHVIVPLLDNEGNLAGIETSILKVFQKLAAASFTCNVSSITSPKILNAVTGDLLESIIDIEILTSWS